ncbi:MAG TPA: enoyl-CoA hydratase-related protein [Actinomycetota bacterium]
MSELVSVATGRVTLITLRRPEQRNALNAAMLDALQAALGAAAGDPAARCIVLQGEGEHFCAGADFGDVAAGAAAGARYGAGFESLLRAIEAHPLPVVAGVHGAALGAGCQLLAACDLAVAAEDARIGIPSARLGLLLDLEKIQRMAVVLGIPTVREMLLSGREWTGVEAAQRGLVNAAVPRKNLATAVAELAEKVASCAPLSVRGSKAGLRAIIDHGPVDRTRDAALFERHDALALQAAASEDLREGLAALRERRVPEFRGR